MSDIEVVEKIEQLKRDRNAILLVHNYQRPEVQEIADFLGDSLGLSRQAASTEAEVIVFCGVHFMAETAKILSPDKTVVMPEIHAGCPMANMVTVEKLVEMKRQHPDATVVTYVNSSAAVKAESDYCCTSANAVDVVQAIPDDKILFVPDRHLGEFVAEHCDKEFILWEGFCPIHMKILAEDIRGLREQWPEAEVLVHPECTADVRALADHVLSTTGICKRAQESSADTLIIGTEMGILHRLERDNPGKRFIAASERAVCPNMKLTTLEKVLWSLEDLAEEVVVEEQIRQRAQLAIDRMVAIG